MAVLRTTEQSALKADLSWLGTGTKYAGLHTQWLGCCGYYTL